jgi:hypothetical protein
MKTENRFCVATWISGFFAAGMLVHFARLVMGWSVSVNGKEISLMTSLMVVIVAGVVSVGLLWLSVKKPCCKTGEKCS